MLKLVNKIQFEPKENKMKIVADTDQAIRIFNSKKSKNLSYLLEKRFNWMNKFINYKDVGIEFGPIPLSLTTLLEPCIPCRYCCTSNTLPAYSDPF